MCGICLILRRCQENNHQNKKVFDLSPIQKRGPDFFGSSSLSSSIKNQEERFCAAVLSLQRDNEDHLVKMPVDLPSSSSKLIWNGEVFFGGGGAEGGFCAAENVLKKNPLPNQSSCSSPSSTSSSDTLFVANTLFELEKEIFSADSSRLSSLQEQKNLFASEVCKFFRSIGGPFAFVYRVGLSFANADANNCGCDTPDKVPAATTAGKGKSSSSYIIFGRDVWGRRSLVVGKGKDELIVSSTVIPVFDKEKKNRDDDDDDESSCWRSSFRRRSEAAFEESLPRDHLFSATAVGQEGSNDDASSSSDATAATAAKNCSNSIIDLLSPGISWEEVKPDGIYEIVVSEQDGDDSPSSLNRSCYADFKLVAKYDDVVDSGNFKCPSSSSSSSASLPHSNDNSNQNQHLHQQNQQQQQERFPARLHPLSEKARFSNHSVVLPQARRSLFSSSTTATTSCVHDSFLSDVMSTTFTLLSSLFETKGAEEVEGSSSISNNNNVSNNNNNNSHKNNNSIITNAVMNIAHWISDQTHWGPDSYKQELDETMKNLFAPRIVEYMNKSKLLQHQQEQRGTHDDSDKTNTTTRRRSVLLSLTCSFVYITVLAIAVHRQTASWNTSSYSEQSEAVENENSNNRNARRRRSLLILFSGGIDCVVLTKLTEISTPADQVCLDLINVSFGKNSEKECMSSVDRISCLDSVRDIVVAQQNNDDDDDDVNIYNNNNNDSNRLRLLLADVTGEEIVQNSSEIVSCLLPKNTVMDTCIGAALYFGARGIGRHAQSATEAKFALETPSISTKIDSFTYSSLCTVSDEGEEEVATRNRFVPLLKCLIRHYVDRGDHEMSICLLGKEYSSDELVKTSTTFGYKTLRHHFEAAANAGLVSIRGVSQALPSSTSLLPQVRQRVPTPPCQGERDQDEDANPSVNEKQLRQQKQKHNHRPNEGHNALPGRSYFISIRDEACLKFAEELRRERLFLGGLTLGHEETVAAAITSSPARIIIAGMGADESLGGYHRYCRPQQSKKGKSNNDLGVEHQQRDRHRHHHHHQQQQQQRLQTEMQKDFDRLWERNLGRDDRVMSSFGKEARFPFLDEAVLFALSGIVSWYETMNLRNEKDDDGDSEGDSELDDDIDCCAREDSTFPSAANLFKNKNLLRFGAENILGISKEVAYKPKKAIQFGTKIANRKNKGEQICL